MTDFAIFELPDHLIPETILEIASYCGKNTAIVLLKNYPGSHIRVPKYPTSDHKLAALLGIIDFTRLCEKFGKETIQIPRAADAIRAVRNQKILHDFKMGVMQSDLAIKYELTERQIIHICNKNKIDSYDE
jgi:hypothetical protein